MNFETYQGTAPHFKGLRPLAACAVLLFSGLASSAQGAVEEDDCSTYAIGDSDPDPSTGLMCLKNEGGSLTWQIPCESLSTTGQPDVSICTSGGSAPNALCVARHTDNNDGSDPYFSCINPEHSANTGPMKWGADVCTNAHPAFAWEMRTLSGVKSAIGDDAAFCYRPEYKVTVPSAQGLVTNEGRSDSIIIFLDGGGGARNKCRDDNAKCAKNWSQHHVQFHRSQVDSEGIFDRSNVSLYDQAHIDENQIYFMKQVFVSSQGGEGHTGMGSTSSNTMGAQFNGHYIVDAVIDDLIDPVDGPIDTLTTRVILAGASNGARGVANNLDYVAYKIKSTLHDLGWSNRDSIEVVGLLDGNMHAPVTLDGVDDWGGQTEPGRILDMKLDASCLEAVASAEAAALASGLPLDPLAELDSDCNDLTHMMTGRGQYERRTGSSLDTHLGEAASSEQYTSNEGTESFTSDGFYVLNQAKDGKIFGETYVDEGGFCYLPECAVDADCSAGLCHATAGVCYEVENDVCSTDSLTNADFDPYACDEASSEDCWTSTTAEERYCIDNDEDEDAVLFDAVRHVPECTPGASKVVSGHTYSCRHGHWAADSSCETVADCDSGAGQKCMGELFNPVRRMSAMGMMVELRRAQADVTTNPTGMHGYYQGGSGHHTHLAAEASIGMDKAYVVYDEGALTTAITGATAREAVRGWMDYLDTKSAADQPWRVNADYRPF